MGRAALGTGRLADSIGRNEFFAGLYILGCANALGGNIINSWIAGDWTGGIQNISAIAWMAIFAGITLVLRDRGGSVKPMDVAVAVISLGLIIAPASELNWVSVTGLSLYVLFFAKEGSAEARSLDWTSSRARGALILLALTVPMLWSRVLFALIAKVFLEIDATLVGWLLGTSRTGNVLKFADGSGDMVILPACSSLANVSLAFLCWVVITQWTEHRRSRADILWCGLACLSVIAINVVRIAIMGLGHWYYITFHFGWGAMLANAVILSLIVFFTVMGVRRELFSHA